MQKPTIVGASRGKALLVVVIGLMTESFPPFPKQLFFPNTRLLSLEALMPYDKRCCQSRMSPSFSKKPHNQIFFWSKKRRMCTSDLLPHTLVQYAVTVQRRRKRRQTSTRTPKPLHTHNIPLFSVPLDYSRMQQADYKGRTV